MTKKTRNRYIDVHGAPIHSGFLRKAFHDVHIRTSLLTMAFSAAALAATGHDTSSVVSMIPFCMFLPLSLSLSTRDTVKDNLARAGINSKTLCIDRVPDAFTPPTSPKMIQKADYIQRTSKAASISNAVFSTLMIGGVSALIMTHDEKPDPGIIIPLTMMWTMFNSATLDSALRARRFGRVVDGTYTIVDPPAPKKRDKKFHIPNPFARHA